MAQFKFLKLMEMRFADPITALDLSLKRVCYGSAMGRLAFYDIQTESDFVISDTAPELIRGISHSQSGDSIYVSVGDISCTRYDSELLMAPDLWQMIDDPDERSHKENCQRAFTLTHQHFNCVITIQLQSQKGKHLAVILQSKLIATRPCPLSTMQICPRGSLSHMGMLRSYNSIRTQYPLISTGCGYFGLSTKTTMFARCTSIIWTRRMTTPTGLRRCTALPTTTA